MAVKGKAGEKNIKKVPTQIAAEIIKNPADRWLREEYIVYSLYTIRDRALLDQDGLKPVNRRILWSMFESGFSPTSSFVKAARIVGDVMGKYHPHGDASIADALARMAQTFAMRVPLIDKSGSVGFVTGDTPAAPRYWEARLTKQSMELIKEVKEGSVELGTNFDGSEAEPKLLPVRWPNDIVNGTKGLAVGFSSNIPSHNPDEVMKAAIAMLKNPEITIDEILKIMPGPDFPTGGEILEVDGIRDYYTTGSGRFTIRARYNVEHLTRGRVRIVFYELPYGVSAENVMTKISTLQNPQEKTVKGRKVPVAPNPVFSKGISTVKDLTDKNNGLKLVIETTQGYNHLQVINELFKSTPLQQSFSANNTVLVDTFPVKVSIMQLLDNFINFRKECTINRSEHRLSKIAARVKQLDALLAALVDIDKAISIIRSASNSDTAKTKLKRSFKLDDDQADYILAMQLRRLTKADSIALKKEKKELSDEIARLNRVLKSDEELKKVVEQDMIDTMKVISDPRRSVITGVTAEQFKEKVKEVAQASKNADKNTSCYVTRFSNGTLLKSDTPFAYKASNKRLANTPIIEQIKMNTKDNIVLIGDDGIGRNIPLSYLIMDKPVSIKNIGIDIPTNVKIVGIAKFESMKSDVGLAIATEQGEVKIAKTDFPNKSEFPVITLVEGDRIVETRWIGRSLSDSFFALVSKLGNVLIFSAKNVRVAGSKAGGVRGMKLKADNDKIIHFSLVEDLKKPENTLVTYSGITLKRTPLSDIPTKGRGGMGVATQLFKNNETELKQAYAGSHAVASIDNKTHNTVTLPPLVKRSTRGVDFNMNINLGSSEIISM